MLRTFPTHRIRPQTELTGLWSFTPEGGPEKGQSRSVAVPSCWETYPGFSMYRGSALYETAFRGQGNLRVVCKGVSHTAEVSLDGRKIAGHYNAFTPFAGILRGAAPGEHKLAIRVTNEFSEASALHVPNDYMTYGGINRPVAVEEIPDAYLEWVHGVPVREGESWSLRVEALVKNIGQSDRRVRLAVELAGQRLELAEQTVAAGGEGLFAGALTLAGVETWSPEQPALYMLETLLYMDGGAEPADDLIERVGFREVAVRGREILLNGRPLRIKGFCRHEDHPHFGCALPLQALDQDLNILRDLGANAVRTSHYPNDELFLDLCDEKGMLVWEENHARGLTEEQMRNPNFRRQCADCIDEMITQHFNHPAIVIWGILNECASETEYGRDCYAEQFAQIKALDTSRPTSFSSCKFFNDLCLGLPDIVSYNIYPEWYHDAPAKEYLDQIYAWIQQDTEGAGKPFLITEIGAGGIYGNRNMNGSKWSEERQAEILEHQVTAVLGKEGCSGIFIWQYCDVRISDEWFMNRPRTMNNKGVVDEFRRRKLSYPVVKALLRAHGNYFGESPR